MFISADAEGIHVKQGAGYFSAGTGAFNAAGVKPNPGHGGNPILLEFDVEYQSAAKLSGVRFFWGIVANTDGGLMGYTDRLRRACVT